MSSDRSCPICGEVLIFEPERECYYCVKGDVEFKERELDEWKPLKNIERPSSSN